jgi:hypothetical protein
LLLTECSIISAPASQGRFGVRSHRWSGKAILQTISEPAIDPIGYDFRVPKLRNPDAGCSIG